MGAIAGHRYLAVWSSAPTSPQDGGCSCLARGAKARASRQGSNDLKLGARGAEACTREQSNVTWLKMGAGHTMRVAPQGSVTWCAQAIQSRHTNSGRCVHPPGRCAHKREGHACQARGRTPARSLRGFGTQLRCGTGTVSVPARRQERHTNPSTVDRRAGARSRAGGVGASCSFLECLTPAVVL